VGPQQQQQQQPLSSKAAATIWRKQPTNRAKDLNTPGYRTAAKASNLASLASWGLQQQQQEPCRTAQPHCMWKGLERLSLAT
jgi:hypothetical protein